MKPTISVVISAYNEEKTLGRCLESVSFADEIIVVDNSSGDRTAAIAAKYTDSVFKRENLLMLNINKNYGFEKAKSEWILNLDADEEIPPVLAREIQALVKNSPDSDGFRMKRKNISFGKWIRYGLWWPDKQVRLFRRGKGKFPCIHIHEYIKVEGKIGELAEPYVHYNYETVSQYLTKIDRASTSESLSLKEMDYQLAWYDAIRFPLSDFLKIYFAQQGYKDGLHGLVLALFQAFYSFCVFAKTWEARGFPARDVQPYAVLGELEARGKEARYWMYTASINESKNIIVRGMLKIRRKLNKGHA
jgi:(heptosyl)LPS beta-1,4-glucosyltransferase